MKYSIKITGLTNQWVFFNDFFPDYELTGDYWARKIWTNKSDAQYVAQSFFSSEVVEEQE